MQVFTFLRRRTQEEREHLRLTEMIDQCSQKMAVLSPVNDFAQYFKHDRVRNRLLDEREKIGELSDGVVDTQYH